MKIHFPYALGAVLLATTTGAAPAPQEPTKAKAFRCFIEDGVAASSEPGKPIEYKPDRFSSNPADSIVTFDLASNRLTGNAGAQDIKVIRDKESTDVLAWNLQGNLVAYTIFHFLPATMPKAAGGIATKGYRMVTSRHLNFVGRLAVSQYVGVCVVTD